MKRKYAYLLIELFLAIAIVSFVLIPMLSYPFRIYKKELYALLERELYQRTDTLFKDLLEELPSHLDAELYLDSEVIEKGYSVAIDSKHAYEYKAVWIVTTEVIEDKALLEAELALIPEDKNNPLLKGIVYHYFIEKKRCAKDGEVHEADKTVSALHTGSKKAS